MRDVNAFVIRIEEFNNETPLVYPPQADELTVFFLPPHQIY